MRRFLLPTLPVAAGIAVAAAILTAPLAGAAPDCENLGGSEVTGGQTTECQTPGNVQIDATPGVFPGENDQFWGFPAYGFI